MLIIKVLYTWRLVKKTRGVTESDAFLLCSFSLLSQRKRTKERATYHLVPLCGTTLRCSILPGVKKLAEFYAPQGCSERSNSCFDCFCGAQQREMVKIKKVPPFCFCC
jgi:hypothetical protein